MTVSRPRPVGASDAAAGQAAKAARTLRGAQLAGARWQTLQHRPAPIAWADVSDPALWGAGKIRIQVPGRGAARFDTNPSRQVSK